MRLFALVALLPALAAAQADPLPTTFLPGGAGAEGCYAQWSTRSAVRAYSAPTESSRLLRSVDAERRIDANDYSESLTAVLRVGRLRALRPIEVTGTRLSTGQTETVRLALNDELTLLAAGPEGSIYFAFGGGVYSGVVPGVSGGQVEIIRPPVTELWVRLVAYDAERPAAWVNTAQAGMASREPFCE